MACAVIAFEVNPSFDFTSFFNYEFIVLPIEYNSSGFDLFVAKYFIVVFIFVWSYGINDNHVLAVCSVNGV